MVKVVKMVVVVIRMVVMLMVKVVRMMVEMLVVRMVLVLMVKVVRVVVMMLVVRVLVVLMVKVVRMMAVKILVLWNMQTVDPSTPLHTGSCDLGVVPYKTRGSGTKDSGGQVPMPSNIAVTDSRPTGAQSHLAPSLKLSRLASAGIYTGSLSVKWTYYYCWRNEAHGIGKESSRPVAGLGLLDFAETLVGGLGAQTSTEGGPHLRRPRAGPPDISPNENFLPYTSSQGTAAFDTQISSPPAPVLSREDAGSTMHLLGPDIGRTLVGLYISRLCYKLVRVPGTSLSSSSNIEGCKEQEGDGEMDELDVRLGLQGLPGPGLLVGVPASTGHPGLHSSGSFIANPLGSPYLHQSPFFQSLVPPDNISARTHYPTMEPGDTDSRPSYITVLGYPALRHSYVTALVAMIGDLWKKVPIFIVHLGRWWGSVSLLVQFIDKYENKVPIVKTDMLKGFNDKHMEQSPGILERAEQHTELKVPKNDLPCNEFLWGPQAYFETTKIKGLEVLAKINNAVPWSFPALYKEALRGEEERAQATTKQTPPAPPSVLVNVLDPFLWGLRAKYWIHICGAILFVTKVADLETHREKEATWNLADKAGSDVKGELWTQTEDGDQVQKAPEALLPYAKLCLHAGLISTLWACVMVACKIMYQLKCVKPSVYSYKCTEGGNLSMDPMHLCVPSGVARKQDLLSVGPAE
ncbi:PREDICTED: uncharacterized protein LOC102828227 [Chrysochloris asiatica]|uniref:Uncharacterized protein LOC102828227 n=1 Tax=Chrysochloris asiatica TaxID=185453 RepID=A0A9B0WKL5_CHRAS|nr:PREDICTED: uncharacterized protein LOC102828227 [Chrysochloris asiatica]